MFLKIGLNVDLPFDNPIIIFMILLILILLVPIVFQKIQIPSLIGFILGGSLIGPYGINLIQRDSSMIISGTLGILYIMFLAGIEIEIEELKKNLKKSIIFGILTFLIPITMGTFISYFILNFSLLSSVLLSSMFSTHTLLTYPIVRKLGIQQNRVVAITIGGTIITYTLALIVLSIVISIAKDSNLANFIFRASFSIFIFFLFVLNIFPIIAKWFFKNFEDSILQYVFVLTMIFVGSFLAELAGFEGIIGAFITGIALNSLISKNSPLMNRIDFVGNSLFIPLFLIGTGMLINYQSFLEDWNSFLIGFIMTIIATVSKFLAASLTRVFFSFSKYEGMIIFGLSNAHTAVTLAIVLVGYNFVLGIDEQGNPVKLLNESVLNGTILMILFTCTIASFVTQKYGEKLLELSLKIEYPLYKEMYKEKILIPLKNPQTVNELIQLSISSKISLEKDNMYALIVLDTEKDDIHSEKKIKPLIDFASQIASATEHNLNKIIRYDLNVINGILNTIKENKITDLIMGFHKKSGFLDSFLGKIIEGILNKSEIQTLIYKSRQPLATHKRFIIFYPINIEKELFFLDLHKKIEAILKNNNCKGLFFCTDSTKDFLLQYYQAQVPEKIKFKIYHFWYDLPKVFQNLQKDDAFIIAMSRKGFPSYHGFMEEIPGLIEKQNKDHSFILGYPRQILSDRNETIDLDPSLNKVLEKPISKIVEQAKKLKKI